MICCVTSCDFVSREEIARVPSPDGIVEAVLIRTNAGATTAFGYELYIVPPGGKGQRGREQLRADHLTDIGIQWRQSKLLEVHYKEGRIFHFSNFWSSKEVGEFNYVVEIRLLLLAQPFSLSAQAKGKL